MLIILDNHGKYVLMLMILMILMILNNKKLNFI
jgi:hypothetical protein